MIFATSVTKMITGVIKFMTGVSKQKSSRDVIEILEQWIGIS